MWQQCTEAVIFIRNIVFINHKELLFSALCSLKPNLFDMKSICDRLISSSNRSQPIYWSCWTLNDGINLQLKGFFIDRAAVCSPLLAWNFIWKKKKKKVLHTVNTKDFFVFTLIQLPNPEHILEFIS